jgi:hypothetical protein
MQTNAPAGQCDAIVPSVQCNTTVMAQSAVQTLKADALPDDCIDQRPSMVFFGALCGPPSQTQ